MDVLVVAVASRWCCVSFVPEVVPSTACLASEVGGARVPAWLPEVGIARGPA